jgi:hypothetical protein
VQSFLTPRLLVPFAIVVLLLLALLVCQLGTGLYVLLAVVVPLLLALLVCQLGTSLYMLLMIAVSLLMSSCGGHAVHIVPLTVNGRQPIPRSGIHSLVCG